MESKIEVLCHSSIKITGTKIIYIDPFKIKENYQNADYIFCTHSHYDHFSEEDINKVKKEYTKIVITNDLEEKTLNLGFKKENITIVEPNNKYKIDKIEIETIPSYNILKQFHPKENNWVGYILKIDEIKYYIAGDTDFTEENQKVKCDMAFLPVGGTYTMNSEEAAKLANIINPKIVVPVHYGCIVGTKKDAEDFRTRLNKNIKCEIMIKEEK